MSQRVVLHPPPALIELGVGQANQMERIGHLDRPGRHQGEHLAIGAREVQGGEAHLVTPRLAPLGQPGHGLGGRAARDDVEELAVPDIDDLGGELLAPPRTPAHHQRLVEAEGLDRAEATRVIDQGSAIGDDGVVDRVPVAAQFGGHLVHTARAPADLFGDPPAGPVGHGQTRRRDAVVLLGPAAVGAVGIRTAPPVLVPEQSRAPAEAGQVDEGHDPLILQVGEHAALWTSWA